MLTWWSHLKHFIREPLQFIHKEQTDSSLRPWLVFCWPEYVLLLISTAVHLASVLLWCSPQHAQQTCPYAPTMDSCGWTAGLCRQCKPTLIPGLGVHAGLTTVAKNGLNLLWGNCCICAKAVVFVSVCPLFISVLSLWVLISLVVQDDRLRTPLLKLKLAVCSVMPEQIARYNMDCIAKVAK